jgi:hypothetical protein
MQNLKNILILSYCFCAGFFLSGCSGPEVVSYTIPKEDRTEPTGSLSIERTSAASAETTVPSLAMSPVVDESVMGMTVLPGMERSAEGAGTLEWGELPQTWEVFPPSGIRIANFRIANDGGSAELTILAFPGDVGGDLANVNRWRQQIGLQALSMERMANETERIEVDGRKSLFVLMHGQLASVVGAFVPTDAHTWFFKMQGDKAAVSLEEQSFRKFMETIRIR